MVISYDCNINAVVSACVAYIPCPVLKIKTIDHARDLWKLALSYRQLRLLCPPNPCNLPGTAFHSGFKASGRFEIYWVKPYLVKVISIVIIVIIIVIIFPIITIIIIVMLPIIVIVTVIFITLSVIIINIFIIVIYNTKPWGPWWFRIDFPKIDQHIEGGWLSPSPNIMKIILRSSTLHIYIYIYVAFYFQCLKYSDHSLFISDISIWHFCDYIFLPQQNSRQDHWFSNFHAFNILLDLNRRPLALSSIITTKCPFSFAMRLWFEWMYILSIPI